MKTLFLAASGTEWSLSFEGMGPGWAFFLLLVAAVGTLLAYRRLVSEINPARRAVLIALRIAIFVIVGILLVRPVLNLTLNEPVRQSLFVLLDTSSSMAFADRRDKPEDVKRAALAAGLLDPGKGLQQSLPEGAGALKNITRWELLEKLAANEKLNLWPRLAAQADLVFFPFGRSASDAGGPSGGQRPTTQEVKAFFQKFRPDQPATAIGDALRGAMQDGRRAGGLLVITDGANNSGVTPVEAAAMAKQENIPLFVYGVGVTAAPDVIVEKVTAPRLAFAGERLDVRARLRAQGIENARVTVTLNAGGSAVDEHEVEIGPGGETEVLFHFEPAETGVLKLEVRANVLPDEVSSENNVATASVRVTDQKFDVLLIEQEPRWDFRYLLAYLQKDRRLNIRAVMIDGEPGLANMENSPFLAALPDDREAFFQSQVLILGDVNPADLGEDRMELIREWVEAGGGIIFLAGPNFNPTAYADTPLASVLPIVPDSAMAAEEVAQRSPEPFRLELTPQGESSSYLLMDPDPEENRRIWEEFPGVRWTAPVSRAKPGAEVLLVDPRPESAARNGPRPVVALQDYGAGTAVFIGMDATWRWRSRTGEKYYSILWGQIMQSLSLQLLEGGSKLTQLKTVRTEYQTGESVVISGNLYTEGFQPLIEPSITGKATVENEGRTTTQTVTLTTDGRGQFHGDFVARTPGQYSFATDRDPEAVLRFSVTDPNLEAQQTALNERLLQAMSSVAGGRFLREEDLDKLPGWLQEKSSTVAVYKRREIYRSGWWLVALIALFSTEWLVRRLSQLK